MTLTGIAKEEFDDLMTYLTDINNYKVRSTKTCFSVLLTIMRSGKNIYWVQWQKSRLMKPFSFYACFFYLQYSIKNSHFFQAPHTCMSVCLFIIRPSVTNDFVKFSKDLRQSLVRDRTMYMYRKAQIFNLKTII